MILFQQLLAIAGMLAAMYYDADNHLLAFLVITHLWTITGHVLTEVRKVNK